MFKVTTSCRIPGSRPGLITSDLSPSNSLDLNALPFSRHCIQHDRKDNFRGSCLPGSAEALARRGGKIRNHHSIAYSLSNTCQKLPKSVDVRWSYSVQNQCRFFETVYNIIHTQLNSTGYYGCRCKHLYIRIVIFQKYPMYTYVGLQL